jgi:hypothetical protein
MPWKVSESRTSVRGLYSRVSNGRLEGGFRLDEDDDVVVAEMGMG